MSDDSHGAPLFCLESMFVVKYNIVKQHATVYIDI